MKKGKLTVGDLQKLIDSLPPITLRERFHCYCDGEVSDKTDLVKLCKKCGGEKFDTPDGKPPIIPIEGDNG